MTSTAMNTDSAPCILGHPCPYYTNTGDKQGDKVGDIPKNRFDRWEEGREYFDMFKQYEVVKCLPGVDRCIPAHWSHYKSSELAIADMVSLCHRVHRFQERYGLHIDACDLIGAHFHLLVQCVFYDVELVELMNDRFKYALRTIADEEAYEHFVETYLNEAIDILNFIRCGGGVEIPRESQ